MGCLKKEDQTTSGIFVQIRLKTRCTMMSGKVALVTGSTVGIGFGVAEALAGKGCNLIVTGIAEQQTIDQVTTKLRKEHGVRVDFVAADLRSVTSIEEFCKEVLTLYPDGVDILVNNAGVQHIDSVENYPTEKWDDMISVSLSAPFHLMKAFIPGMKKKGWGRIVNMSSQMAVISGPGKAPYSAAKAGLVGLTKGVALECAADGITCNCICPGFADAPMFIRSAEKIAAEEGVSMEEAKARGYARNPTKKPVTVKQIADLALFMCSESGASMTGSAVVMDGGFTSQ